jgi:hypothetical protein
LKLRYLIGKDADPGTDDSITVIGYDATTPPKNGVKYCNLLDEKNTGKYGPHVPSDTGAKFNEPAPDPDKPGFWENLREQLDRAKSQGFTSVELDNLDTYTASVALLCFNEARERGLTVWVKNPFLVDGDSAALMRHPAAWGAIVEPDCGTPAEMQAIRNGLPVYFVSGDYDDANISFPNLPLSGQQPEKPMASLAQKIVGAAERRGAVLDRQPGEINIVYVEGMDADGSPNRNRVNAFDDLRCVIAFVNGEPRILGSWEATTAPGERYTKNPINDDGAAIIALGYQRAWQVGMHPMSNPDHLALVQTGGSVRVNRDKNKDYAREGDIIQAGWFGINQHWGYDQPKDNIGPASAGCLVGRSKDGHREFMKLVQADPRYIADSKHIFGTTVVTAKDVAGDSVVAETGYRSLIGGFFSNPDALDQPVSIRSNNPGAINGAAWERKLPGYVKEIKYDGKNNTTIFYTPEQGVAVWWELMRKYASGGHTTVGAIINRYGGGQNYEPYINFVVSKTGLSRDTAIELEDDDDTLLKFAKAMFHYEAGRATPLSDAQILYGFDYARAGFKEPERDVPPPDDGGDTVEEPVRDDKPKNMDEAIARLDAVVADIKELARVAAQPAPQLDWAKIIQPLLAELAPKILPMLMPIILKALPDLMPFLLDAMFNRRQSVMSKPGVQASAAGGIGAIIGALATQFLNK